MEPIKFVVKSEPQLKINVVEDVSIAKGHHAHIFNASYNQKTDHYTLEFFQDSTISVNEKGENIITRYLVSRIILTTPGLAELGGALTSLQNQVAQKKQLRLPNNHNLKNEQK